MDFAAKINSIMQELGADNISIARYGGFDRTSLSRFRNGRRVPGASSKTAEMLVNGIYLYADNENALEKLCGITGGDPEGSASEIKDSVRVWLFDGMEGTRASGKAERKTYMLNAFSEKLDAAMTTAEISNIRLSKLMSVDSSLISRFRTGVRTPRSNPEMAQRLSDILWHYLQNPSKKEILSGLMKTDAGMINRETFYEWLCDFDIMQQEQYMDVEKLMAAFDSYSSATGTLPLAPGEELTLPEDRKFIYTGTEGLREAVIRFLGNASETENKEIWLYSDEKMDWLTADTAFRKKWVSLMLSCAHKGIRIRIIHNVDRGFKEMSEAIISWLPLYMTGMIESFYCKKTGGNRFSHSLYICPGYAAIGAFHVSGMEHEGIYHYYTDKETVDVLGAEYEKLLTQSAPLVSVTEPMLQVSAKSGMTSIRNTLSVATMPEELADSFGSESLKAMWRAARKELTECLKDSYVYECVPLADPEKVSSGEARVNTLSATDDLKYIPRQYSAHIRHIVEMLKEYPNYRFYVMPDNPFRNMVIIAGNDYVKVSSTANRPFSFVFTHPLLCSAFKEYIDDIRRNSKTDRHTLRKQLSEYADQIYGG